MVPWLQVQERNTYCVATAARGTMTRLRLGVCNCSYGCRDESLIARAKNSAMAGAYLLQVPLHAAACHKEQELLQPLLVLTLAPGRSWARTASTCTCALRFDSHKIRNT